MWRRRRLGKSGNLSHSTGRLKRSWTGRRLENKSGRILGLGNGKTGLTFVREEMPLGVFEILGKQHDLREGEG